MKITLSCDTSTGYDDGDNPGVQTTMVTEEPSIEDLLEVMSNFLRACNMGIDSDEYLTISSDTEENTGGEWTRRDVIRLGTEEVERRRKVVKEQEEGLYAKIEELELREKGYLAELKDYATEVEKLRAAIEREQDRR